MKPLAAGAELLANGYLCVSPGDSCVDYKILFVISIRSRRKQVQCAFLLKMKIIFSVGEKLAFSKSFVLVEFN